MPHERIGGDARADMRAIDRYSSEHFFNPPLVFAHPSDVLREPNLTLDERREILAGWISDANAIESAPHLRRNAAGDVVPVAAIMDALRTLDLQAARAAPTLASRRLGDGGRSRDGLVLG